MLKFYTTKYEYRNSIKINWSICKENKRYVTIILILWYTNYRVF